MLPSLQVNPWRRFHFGRYRGTSSKGNHPSAALQSANDTDVASVSSLPCQGIDTLQTIASNMYVCARWHLHRRLQRQIESEIYSPGPSLERKVTSMLVDSLCWVSVNQQSAFGHTVGHITWVHLNIAWDRFRPGWSLVSIMPSALRLLGMPCSYLSIASYPLG